MEEGQGRPRRMAKSRSLLRMMEMRDNDETTGNKSWDSSRMRKAKGDNLHGEPTHCGVCFSTGRTRMMICCDYCQEWYHRDCIGIGRDAYRRIIKYACPPCASILKFNPEEEEAGEDMAEQEEGADQALIQETNPVAETVYTEEQGGKEPAEEEKEPEGDKEDKEKASRKTVKSTKKRKKPKISAAYERQKRKLKQKEMMEKRIKEKVKTSTSSSSKPKALKATGTAVRQPKRLRCRQCEPCKVVKDCGKCSFCLDKTKFGGQNKLRQKCLFRTCIRMASIPFPAVDVGLVDHYDYTARPEPDPTTEKKKEKEKKKKKDKKERQPEDKEKQIPPPTIDVSLVDHYDYTARPERDPTTKKTTEDKEEIIAANYYEFFNPEKRKQPQQEPTIDEPQPKRVCFPAAEEDLPLGKTTGAKSAMVGKTASKLQTLLIADKVNLIEEVENCGTKNRTDIAAEWGISISELNGIMRKKGTVMEQFRKQCLIRARQVEEAVLMWCKAAQAMNILVTRQILEEKAKSLAKKLGFPNFTLSDGWLDLFKARNNVSFNVVARAGAAGLSDERKALSSTTQLRVHQMVKDWLITDLSPLLVVYKPSNIFNANETGIFYRLLPDCLLTSKGKTCSGGEGSEERLTAMVCANMDGSEKLPLLVIGKTKKPQCLANVKTLPTQYEANKTAWMTSDIFEAWARNIDKLCQEKNRKIVIVIDSCPAHPHITGLKSVTLVFLSPLTAANRQPMEQGIIRNLKMHYRRQLITSFLAAVDRKEEYNPTVLDAMILLKKSWKMVKDTTISHCFKLAGFERKKTATILDIETAEPDVDINAATEDKNLFDQLRDTGMDIPWETTLKSYAAVDADVRCTTGLSDDAILGAVSSSAAEVNNVEDDYESTTPYPDVSVAEAMQHLDKLQHFALQNHHTEGMLDAICDIEQVIGLVRKDNATQKT